MRTSSLALFSLVLLFLLTTKPRLGAARPDPVLDVSGKKLREGISYYILPVIRGRGGGLTLGGSGNDTCPLYVVQEPFETFKGQPVTFSPAIERKDKEIHTSSDMNIKFSAVNNCGESTVWKLLKKLTGVWFVSTGGAEGNPGVETVVNWFKIELAGDLGYSLAFCPSVTGGGTLCKELGTYVGDDMKRHLALGDDTVSFPVVFLRADAEPLMSIV